MRHLRDLPAPGRSSTTAPDPMNRVNRTGSEGNEPRKGFYHRACTASVIPQSLARIMTAYVGWRRETAVQVEVVDLGAGAGEVSCFECGGSGIFTGHPEIPELPCIACKSTGRILIGIA